MKRHILATVIYLFAAPAMALAAGNNILSVHILDQQNRQTGARRGGVVLEQKKDNGWTQLNTRHTDGDGRIKALWPKSFCRARGLSRYFKTGQYFEVNWTRLTEFPSVSYQQNE